jgi:hypothetical protein
MNFFFFNTEIKYTYILLAMSIKLPFITQINLFSSDRYWSRVNLDSHY